MSGCLNSDKVSMEAQWYHQHEPGEEAQVVLRCRELCFARA